MDETFGLSMGNSVYFGKYELIERIGSGGMAEVYKAKLPSLHGLERVVAIKRILPYHCEDTSFINMFLDEAKITLALTHPCVGQVYELNQVNGQYYIAMEYIDGPNLSTVVKRLQKKDRRLPLDFTLYIMTRVCAGLYAAHTQHDASGRELAIIHRDVSPHNVMVSKRGDVKLIDFGIAKARDRLVQTVAGTVRGKLLYMSPEQAASQELDARSDIFSTGMMFLTFLNGRHIWRGLDEVEVLVAIRRWGPPSVRELRPDLPPEALHALQLIIDRSMSFKVEDRYPDAEAFRVDLATLLAQINPGFSAVPLGHFITEVAEGRVDLAEPSTFATPTGPTTGSVPSHDGVVSGGFRSGEISGVRSSNRRGNSGGMAALTFAPSTATDVRENTPSQASRIANANTPLPELHTPSHSRQLAQGGTGPGQRLPTGTVPAVGSTHQTEPGLKAIDPNKKRISPVVLVGAAVGVIAVLLIAVVVMSLVINADPGTFDINSDPPGAFVTIDGAPIVEKTNTRVGNLPPGEHTVMLTLGGYETFETRIQVVSGERGTINHTFVALEKPPEEIENDDNAVKVDGEDKPEEIEEEEFVTLQIYSNVTGGELLIDGSKFSEKTHARKPLSIQGLEMGNDYQLKLTRGGFEDGGATVKLDDLAECRSPENPGACREHTINLKRKEPERPKNGKLTITSFPTARCNVTGPKKQSCATPCSGPRALTLPPGNYGVSCTAGSVTQSRRTSIKAGGNASLKFNLTKPAP